MQITIQIQPEALARIDAAAAAWGMNRSTFMRVRTLGMVGPEPLPLLPPASPTMAPTATPTPEPIILSLNEASAMDWLLLLRGRLGHDADMADALYLLVQRLLGRPALERVAPQHRARAEAPEVPPGYVFITVMEQDVGKDAWMTPADAGVA